MSSATAYLRSHPLERGAAMTSYALMFLAPFTLNALGLVAVAIGYARRGRADPITRSHYDHQIRRFWLDLMMVGLGFVCASGALAAGFGAVLEAFLQGLGVALPWSYDPVHIGLGAIGLAMVWLLCWGVGFGGLMIGSVLGAMRLASGLPAGRPLR